MTTDQDRYTVDPLGDPLRARQMAGFPTEQPMEFLEKDHDFVRQLFDRYLNTQDLLVKKEAGSEILLLLGMHTALEEATFYPMVRDVDPQLVDECMDQHAQARRLMEKLQGMDVTDPQCDDTFRQLQDAILHHVGVEENQLFPKVRQANLDLEAIGLQMAAYEANAVAAQASAAAGRGASAP